MLPVSGLEFASHAEVLYPSFILVLLVPLDLAFLIVCPSWDLVMPHLPALNEAGCCLSLSNRPDKMACQPRPLPGCLPAALQPLLADGHSLSLGWGVPSPGPVWTRQPHGEQLLNFYLTFPSRRYGRYLPGNQFLSSISSCLNFDWVQSLL